MRKNNPILILDHNTQNLTLLDQFLQKAGYNTIAVTTLDGLRQVLTNDFKSRPILLALLDIAGFDKTIWGPIEDIHTKGIPFLIISAGSGNRAIIQREGADRGAAGVLIKPLIGKELLHLIKQLILQPD